MSDTARRATLLVTRCGICNEALLSDDLKAVIAHVLYAHPEKEPQMKALLDEIADDYERLDSKEFEKKWPNMMSRTHG